MTMQTVREGTGLDVDGRSTNGRSTNGRFHPLMQLHVAPMARLLLLNMPKGEVYTGVEPQWFDDDVHGRGLLVILYRVDGRVDVYHQPSVAPDPDGYEIEAGLHQIVACDFARARLEISAHGMDADIAFSDRDGREIVVRVHEQTGRRGGRFALLAPLGHAIQQPQAMPLFFMYDFSFIKVRGTALEISVDGVLQTLPKLPVPLDGSRVYMGRYCADPLITFLNPAPTGAQAGALPVAGPGTVTAGETAYMLEMVNGRPAMRALSAGRTGNPGMPARQTRLTFAPPLPEVTGLADGETVYGRFAITSDPAAGEVNGQWQLARRGDRVTLRLHPDAGWRPGEKQWMPRLIFALLRPFTQWPKTYEWTATVDLSQQPPQVRSHWRRTT